MRPFYSIARRARHVLFFTMTAKTKKKKTGVPPDSPSRPPRGTSPPGWEPLFYVVTLYQEEFGYCYQSGNVMTLGLAQSDHIKRLPLNSLFIFTSNLSNLT